MSRIITYAKAINEALHIAMEKDRSVINFGLGMDDPKRVFDTTTGLKEKFGSERVFDMPVAENGMTGVAIGASLNGLRPVMSHQRLDFFLLAMDQLVNNAAKWHYMFGGRRSVPITIRLILGRGWGQGPQHSQNLQSWFAHIPGLKVVMPTTAYDAKGLLLSAIFDDNPVIYLEHRWLHSTQGEVPEEDFRVPIGKANVLCNGEDVTIVSMSYMTVEALHAIDILKSSGISAELVDLRSVNPIDWETVFRSVSKTGRLIALDTANETLSVASEIIARVSMELYGSLKSAPARVALSDFPSPTSHALTEGYYKRAEDVVAAAGKMFAQDIDLSAMKLSRLHPHDVPGDWFKGPF